MEYLNQTSVQELGHQATVVAVTDRELLRSVAGSFLRVKTVTVLAVLVPLAILVYRLLIDRKLVSCFTS
jgi:hypothetical protein